MKVKQVDQLHVARINALIADAAKIADQQTLDLFRCTTMPLVYNDEWDRFYHLAMNMLAQSEGLRVLVDHEVMHDAGE